MRGDHFFQSIAIVVIGLAMVASVFALCMWLIFWVIGFITCACIDAWNFVGGLFS